MTVTRFHHTRSAQRSPWGAYGERWVERQRMNRSDEDGWTQDGRAEQGADLEGVGEVGFGTKKGKWR